MTKKTTSNQKSTQKPESVIDTSSNLDDIDFSSLATPQNHLESLAAEKILTVVPVRKPNKTEFVRVLNNPAYTRDFSLVELREERETYLFHSSLHSMLDSIAIQVQIVVAMTRLGDLFLWPLKMTESGRQNNWHKSARSAAKLAEEKWISLRPNMGQGAYDIIQAVDSLPDPEWPTDKYSFEDLVKIAFADFYISSEDHPVVRRLQGKV